MLTSFYFFDSQNLSQLICCNQSRISCGKLKSLRKRSADIGLSVAILLHQLDNVTEITVQRLTDLSEDLRADMLILAQLGQGSGRHACSQTQVLLLHILVDQELPQFIVANSHN